MPFAFRLSTTSYVAIQENVACSSHPSLPVATSTARGVVRAALKRYKRLPSNAQQSELASVQNALAEYLPLLSALDNGLSGRAVAGETVLATLEREVDAEWRLYLTAAVPGREGQRAKLKGFEYDLLFALLACGETHYLIARRSLHSLYDAATPTAEQRSACISVAMKSFLDAHAVFDFARTRCSQLSKPPPVADISASMLGALAALSLSEATLISVLKDDPYPAAVVQDRNKADKEWMFKAPDIPKVRAHLFARLCLAAADHAAKGAALAAGSAKANTDLIDYLQDLKRTARGKACRFFAIDAELSGKTGEGIAWLNGAKSEMGLASADGDKRGTLSKLKKDWAERREDKKIVKAGDWGNDAGKFEEGRVADTLLAKWNRMNDTVNIQAVPPFGPLLAAMPSGREYHAPKPWQPPALDRAALAGMRAPPDPTAAAGDESDDSDDAGGDAGGSVDDPVGAFPGTGPAYTSKYY